MDSPQAVLRLQPPPLEIEWCTLTHRGKHHIPEHLPQHCSCCMAELVWSAENMKPFLSFLPRHTFGQQWAGQGFTRYMRSIGQTDLGKCLARQRMKLSISSSLLAGSLLPLLCFFSVCISVCLCLSERVLMSSLLSTEFYIHVYLFSDTQIARGNGGVCRQGKPVWGLRDELWRKKSSVYFIYGLINMTLYAA